MKQRQNSRGQEAAAARQKGHRDTQAELERPGTICSQAERTQGHSGRTGKARNNLQPGRKDTVTLRRNWKGQEQFGARQKGHKDTQAELERPGTIWSQAERTQGHSGRTGKARNNLEPGRKDTVTLRQNSRGQEQFGARQKGHRDTQAELERPGTIWSQAERTQGHSGRTQEARNNLEPGRKDTRTLRQNSRGQEQSGARQKGHRDTQAELERPGTICSQAERTQ